MGADGFPWKALIGVVSSEVCSVTPVVSLFVVAVQMTNVECTIHL